MNLFNFFLLIFGHLASKVWCSCYFSDEYQGIYLTQNMNDGARDGITYSKVQVTPTGVSTWGECYRRTGQNFILNDVESRCYRCITIINRSSNVLQVFSKDLVSCYTRAEMALQSCPTQMDLIASNIQSYLLIKFDEGEQTIQPIFCPISGKFTFDYQMTTDKSENDSVKKLQCFSQQSRLSNCPNGSQINVDYKNCNFDRPGTTWTCLASWKTALGENLLVFKDSDNSRTPTYRCASYDEIAGTGEVRLTLFKDSLCSNLLTSEEVQTGEVYNLKRESTLPWPSILSKAQCKFATWSHGYWEDMYITQNSLVFTDTERMKSFSGQCVQQSNKSPNRFLIYTRSQCGDEEYNCIWFEPRSENILEFQLGLYPSKTPSLHHCDNNHFLQKTWFTQGRRNAVTTVKCPLSGEYIGTLPDEPGLCSQMKSDCGKGDTMSYTVTQCKNNTNLFEEREYQCLGQWEEKGHIFTYTKRKDIDQFECFVGFRESQGKVILGEAGKNCKREINLQVFGMTLIKKEECKRNVIFEPVRISTTEKTSTENPSKELISDTKGSNSCIHRISNFMILIQIIRYLL